jgi:hypothetical protein
LKVTILSVLPKSWSIWKVQESFWSASNLVIMRAKQLLMD